MMVLFHLPRTSCFFSPTPHPSPHLHQRTPFPPLGPFTPHSPKPPKPLSLITKTPFFITPTNPLHHYPLCRAHTQQPTNPDEQSTPQPPNLEKIKKQETFWGAVGLIIGTAVGPGMLALPSATIKSGPIPSTIAIILSWVYVISSIVLVAELSFAAMEEDNVDEVSFTALATSSFGPLFGAFVAVVYASLSFALMIACVSGIGSLVVQQFPVINPVIAHAIFPCFVGILIGFFPFKAIDVTNRLLCCLMLFSITLLVTVGLSIGRTKLLTSLAYWNCRPEVILPAIPVTVLTLGFHVITPFVCNLVGGSMYDARKAILLGGAVPLAMVLSWNVVVLGMAGAGRVSFEDPIKLLLSVNSSALPAVQGFAFAALATSLIGYAVSFPKQLADTVQLITQRFNEKWTFMNSHVGGRVGFAIYSRGKMGSPGEASFAGCKDLVETLSEGTNQTLCLDAGSSASTNIIMWGVLIVPIFIASFFSTAFSRALDFAGVYANCFLFGVLPPAMAWIHRSRRRDRSATFKEDLLPGGNVALILLFGIAVVLGFWH